MVDAALPVVCHSLLLKGKAFIAGGAPYPARSDLRHGRRTGIVPDGLGVKQVIEQVRLVVHPVAVDVAPALADIPVVDLHPVFG